MLIYYVLILVWIIIYITTSKITYNKRKQVLSFLLGSTLFLVMAFRDKSVGVDIQNYLDLYNSKSFLNYDFFERLEYGYQALMRLSSFLGFSDQLFLVLISFFISFSLTRFFYKYSENIFLSFFLHLTIGLFIVTMSALRQSIAICIILFAIDFILKRKLILFLITVYIATTFHLSAFIMFPVYFCYNIKLDSYKKLYFIIFGMFSFVFMRGFFLSTFEKIIPLKYSVLYEVISDDIQMNILLLVIAIAIPIFLVVVMKFTNENIKSFSKENSFFFILTCLNTLFTILALNSIMISRISYYFIPAYIVLIPNVFSRLNLKSNKIIIYGGLLLVCFIYFVLGTVGNILQIDNYQFFFL